MKENQPATHDVARDISLIRIALHTPSHIRVVSSFPANPSNNVIEHRIAQKQHDFSFHALSASSSDFLSRWVSDTFTPRTLAAIPLPCK